MHRCETLAAAAALGLIWTAASGQETTPDGMVVDVRLSRDYAVLVIEGDSEAADTGDAGS